VRVSGGGTCVAVAVGDGGRAGEDVAEGVAGCGEGVSVRIGWTPMLQDANIRASMKRLQA